MDEPHRANALAVVLFVLPLPEQLGDLGAHLSFLR